MPAIFTLAACSKDKTPEPTPDPKINVPAPDYNRSFIRFKVDGIFIELTGGPNGAYISHATNGMGLIYDNDSTGSNAKQFAMRQAQTEVYTINAPITYSRTAANGFSTIYLTGGTMYSMTEGVAAESTPMTITQIVDLGNGNSIINSTFSAPSVIA